MTASSALPALCRSTWSVASSTRKSIAPELGADTHHLREGAGIHALRASGIAGREGQAVTVHLVVDAATLEPINERFVEPCGECG